MARVRMARGCLLSYTLSFTLSFLSVSMPDPVAVTPGPNGAWLAVNQRPFGPFLPSGSICRIPSILAC